MRTSQVSLLVRRRRRRQVHRSSAFDRRLGRSSFGCGLIAVPLLVLALVLAGLAFSRFVAGLPSADQLPVLLNPSNGVLLQPTRLYDHTGEKLLLVLDNSGVRRRYLSIDPAEPEHLSPYLLQVTVALYDPNFWRQPGFAWWRPFDPNPLTLPEHLASDLLLETESPGLLRTLRMRLLAGQIVATYGRSQALEWYLNSASYGHLAYGAESASQLYLGKPASALNLPEAALIASLANAPTLNPLDSPAAAMDRQREALDRLLSLGAITEQDYLSYRQMSLALREAMQPPPEIAPAFNRMVLEQLSSRYGRKRVEMGGLKIVTSLDYDLQLQFACAAQSQVQRLEGFPGAVSPLPGSRICETAALLPEFPTGQEPLPDTLVSSGVLLDLDSSQVLALLGDSSPRSEGSSLNGHQPGSLLSPFVAMAGFARGLSPAGLVWDVPSSLPAGLSEYANPDGRFHGPQRLRMALANDYLAPLSQLLVQIGAPNVWRLAEPLGLSLQSGQERPEELLYAGGYVSPLDVAQAYSTFARLGEQSGERRSVDNRLKPVVLLRVEDQTGRPWLQAGEPQRQPVLSAQLAYLVHDVLSDETARWPSLGYPNPLEIGRPVGAKAGQAAGGSEVWAVGYTPQRLAVVWMGSHTEQEQSPRLQPAMAAGIWHAVMAYATRDLPPGGWEVPAGISQLLVCDPSGQLPTVDCPVTLKEVFVDGSEPLEYDSLYQVVAVNRDTGKLATVFTPLESVEERTYLNVPPEARAWAQEAGLELPPTEYDTIRAPKMLPDAHFSSPELFSVVAGKITLRGTAGGQDFDSYRLEAGQGVNPRLWLQIGETYEKPVDEGVLGVWDTRGLKEGLYAVRLMVVRSDQQVQAGTIQVTVDNTAPVVRVLFPQPGATFGPSERAISLEASIDEAVGVERVEWIVDGRRVGETGEEPYVHLWESRPGEHTLQVKAYDLAGSVGDSETLQFRVK